MILQNMKCYIHILMPMRATSLYLELSLVTLCLQEMGSFDPSNACQSYFISQNNRILKKNIVLCLLYAN